MVRPWRFQKGRQILRIGSVGNIFKKPINLSGYLTSNRYVDMFIYPGSHVFLSSKNVFQMVWKDSLKPWGLWCGSGPKPFGRATKIIDDLLILSMRLVAKIVDLLFSGILLHEGFPQKTWKVDSKLSLENHPQFHRLPGYRSVFSCVQQENW